MNVDALVNRTALLSVASAIAPGAGVQTCSLVNFCSAKNWYHMRKEHGQASFDNLRDKQIVTRMECHHEYFHSHIEIPMRRPD